MSTQFVTRAYNRFEIDYVRSTITKLSKEKRLWNEIQYYKFIPEELRVFFPAFYGDNLEDVDTRFQEYSMTLELCAYDNLGDYFTPGYSVCGGLENSAFREIAIRLEKILKIFQDYMPAIVGQDNFIDDLKKMYEEKTETEYKRLIDNFVDFKKISSYDTIQINGKIYENFDIIWPKLKPYFSNVLYHGTKSTVIHGDFCFSNILVGFSGKDNFVLKFIDPRGEFGQYQIYGDTYYDLAKLAHSTEGGYEFIINDEFDLKSNDALNVFEYSLRNYEPKVHQIFDEVLYSKYNKQKIKLLEACIFVGMVARHYDSIERQKLMYITGVKLLNEVYEEIKCVSV